MQARVRAAAIPTLLGLALSLPFLAGACGDAETKEPAAAPAAAAAPQASPAEAPEQAPERVLLIEGVGEIPILLNPRDQVITPRILADGAVARLGLQRMRALPCVRSALLAARNVQAAPYLTAVC